LGDNRCAALLSMLKILDAQHARALAEHDAVAVLLEGPASFIWGVLALRQLTKETLAHHAERIDLAVGAADEEEIGLVAAKNADRFTQREEGRDVAFGDRVVRPLGVVQHRYVASMHVGQVLEHP